MKTDRCPWQHFSPQLLTRNSKVHPDHHDNGDDFDDIDNFCDNDNNDNYVCHDYDLKNHDKRLE